LRSVLRRTFQERNVHFIDHVGFLQVDALSGIWGASGDDGDDEYSNNNAQLSRGLNIRQPSNNVHSHLHKPYPEDSESRGRAVGFSRIPSEIDALQQQLRSCREEESMTIENSTLNHPSTAPYIGASTNVLQFNPPSLGSNMIHIKEPAIMATHERLQQGSVASPNDVLSQLHEQAILATRKKPLQYTVAAHNDSVSQLHHVRDCLSSYSNEYTSYNVPLPSVHATVLHPSPTGTTIAAAEQFSPQDHGSMLLYNPYDPIEHALQLNISTTKMSPLFFHGGNMGSLTRGRSSPMLSDVSGPYLNTTSDVPRNSDTTAGGITRMLIHHRHCDEGDVHGNNGHLSSSNENFGLSPPPVLYIQQRVRSPSSSSPSRDSDDIPIISSRSLTATHAYSLPRKQPDWGRCSISSGHHIDSEIHRAISESQATHIAHTRQQVADDIEFRRSLELASNESARNLGVEAVDVDEQEAELELALRQSEHVHVLRQKEDERIRASEEQLIADLLLRTRIEEESAKRDEEEILRKALITSLEDDWNVEESALLAEAVTKSVNDNAATPTNHDETLERVLQLSLEEEEKMNEEEEILRRALVTSLEDGWNVDESALLAEAVTKSVNDNAATPTNHDETLERVLQLSLEEEEKMNEEEEILRRALVTSLEDGWNVDESALLAEAVTKSVNDNAATPTNHDETLERVLQLSLEEEEKMNEDEEEHIRKAVEQSMLDMARW